MLYRGPGLIEVVGFGSSPTHSPPPSVSSTCDTHAGRLRKRDNLLTGEGVWEEPNHTKVLYQSSQYSLL
jgi:hypothetical protein